MDVPEDLRYSDDHEWVARDGDRVRVGITDYAQDALGDVVFVDLPEVGAEVRAGQPFGEVESTKSVSELFSPLDGEVVEVNGELVDRPELVNSDPYGSGWMIVVRATDPSQIEGLLDAAAYRRLIGD